MNATRRVFGATTLFATVLAASVATGCNGNAGTSTTGSGTTGGSGGTGGTGGTSSSGSTSDTGTSSSGSAGSGGSSSTGTGGSGGSGGSTTGSGGTGGAHSDALCEKTCACNMGGCAKEALDHCVAYAQVQDKYVDAAGCGPTFGDWVDCELLHGTCQNLFQPAECADMFNAANMCVNDAPLAKCQIAIGQTNLTFKACGLAELPEPKDCSGPIYGKLNCEKGCHEAYNCDAHTGKDAAGKMQLDDCLASCQ